MNPLSRLATAVALALPLATPAFAADPVVQKVTVRAVAHFDFDRAVLAADDSARILAEVGKMTDVSWQTVTATGHTDSVGPSEHNARLSARRAEAVKAYLVGKGLDAQMISTEARAAERPAASNDTPDGRAKNRRTEIRFEGVRSVSR
jgi:OmpA-OmpF porin, OOP family